MNGSLQKLNFIEGLEIIEEDAKSLSYVDGSTFKGTNKNDGIRTQKLDKNRILVSRVVVFFMVLVSAVAVSASAMKLLKRNEAEDFESQSILFSKEIAHLSTLNAQTIFQAIRNLAQLYPAMAEAQGETLPFVTFDNFEALAFGARRLAKAETIIYLPLLKSAEDISNWVEYSKNNTAWLRRGRSFDRVTGTKYSGSQENTEISDDIAPMVYRFAGPPPLKRVPVSPDDGVAAPVWQLHPTPANGDIINYDLGKSDVFKELLNFTMSTSLPVLSGQSVFGGNQDEREDKSPDSLLLYPIFNGFPQDDVYELVGHMVTLIPWTRFLSDVLQEDQEAVVVMESCDTNSTFILNGSNASWVGDGDQHDARFDYLMQKRELLTFLAYENVDQFDEVCRHQMYIFPTATTFERVQTRKPALYTAVIVAIFVLMGFVIFGTFQAPHDQFFLPSHQVYDFLVTSRQEKTEEKAEKSNAIVQELFPGKVAEQLFNPEREEVNFNSKKNTNKTDSASVSLTTMTRQTAIAELYPNATIMFADIAGFTSWSSLREPAQVFLLLESIFQSFDVAAKRMGVFKVETIGDCYVAVCGVPRANVNHAVVMAEFAREALLRFDTVVRGDLEMSLGPDTAELGLRIGLHTGPVTAGVLRGERARFQLFGDSVNTTARIESTGLPDRIHLSEQLAQELIARGKKDWLIRRDDKVIAKGKGELETFWLMLDSGRVCDNTLITVEGEDSDPTNDIEPQHRTNTNMNLIQWNTEIITQLLSHVVASRPMLQFDSSGPVLAPESITRLGRSLGATTDIVSEISDVIPMPSWISNDEPSTIQSTIDQETVSEIRMFVEEIATLYNDIPFHNFQHASHVAMSTNKMLSCKSHNYGVETDPNTGLACFFSALVHDVGHVGVPNGALAKESPSLALTYKSQSIAEQRSVSIAWDTLFKDKFSNLRAHMFSNEAELRHFRQLLVNTVMGTDIFDESLRAERQTRWNQVFGGEFSDDADRRTTIVIEHLIQASDVSHTMQHWHVYRKWNERLFCEMYQAFVNGRSGTDPRSTWYEGELWFFDKYVIPLAHKLRDCNFGAASDECLNYATANRNEWSKKGRDLIDSMTSQFDSGTIKV